MSDAAEIERYRPWDDEGNLHKESVLECAPLIEVMATSNDVLKGDPIVTRAHRSAANLLRDLVK